MIPAPVGSSRLDVRRRDRDDGTGAGAGLSLARGDWLALIRPASMAHRVRGSSVDWLIMDDDPKFDRLQTAADEAQDAFVKHSRRVPAAWWGSLDAATPVSREWLDRYSELRAERDRTEEAVAAFLDRFRQR